MQYEKFDLPNGLRMIHFPSNSPVSYCGFAVNAGTRDELSPQFGIAHFIEHMLFKGTRKRKAWHILNRMENVGGELNAYTSKEETLLYAVSLSEDVERAIELLVDITFHATFPESEIEKEREVVLDEINSYKDNPSELIFDDFENLLFEGHEIGHHILGETATLQSLNRSVCLEFFECFYQAPNMVFFSFGKIPFKKIHRLVSNYTAHIERIEKEKLFRQAPNQLQSRHLEIGKDLHQTHVMIGSRGYDLHHKNRMGLHLLNNLLGGPGMNSRLNVSLREKHGLVYTVESSSTSYTDTGIFSIYFGCDHQLKDKCFQLTICELKKLRDIKLSTSQLAATKKQLKGQLGIAGDQSESLALGMGKSFLHYNAYDNLQQIYEKIDRVSSEQLLEIANEILSENNLFSLIYR